ncbi:MAG: CDP-diacylglycerol--serine O-phosphatidyltransferase [Desulfobacterales bacterium]|nr:CDP-diacylglycerol--serine O-phosphatidyltransferase [Desulfobacterales bacterium]
MKKKKIKKYKLRRGIYILPNIFTTMNLFCGFYAVIASLDGNYYNASLAIIIAAVFDTLDGKIARATRTSSRFGVEYDSLADVMSFGLAPAILMYLWALKPFGRIGWLAAFLFLVCGALRLARFNTRVDEIPSDYFQGLPIPAGAAMNATTVLFCHRLNISGNMYPVVILVLLYILSFLMVSTIKYNSFKKPELFRKINFNVLVTCILIFIFIAALPSIALFLLSLLYVGSGPFNMFRLIGKPNPENTETETQEEVVQ